jgi:uracil-DNA glycosylase
MTSAEFDPGPPTALAQHLASLPSYAPHKQWFWFDWAPVFYRGRLDGSAKLLGIASDPGPTEQIACRTLVGDAGQRVQGFLAKLGLEQSYVLVNAFAYALHPSAGSKATAMLSEAAHKQWRNHLLDSITGPKLQAIVAFGVQGQAAADLWTTRPNVPLLKVPHPSNRSTSTLLSEWKKAITQLRGLITPDAGGTNTGPNYGTTFKESDYAAVPARDLPFAVPDWLGDDAWGRKAKPRHNNSVDREGDDKISWQAPPNQ